jgi:inward rectifier potassium channel
MRWGDFEAQKLGVRRFDIRDPYPALLSLSWPRFLALVGLLYLVLNLIFAVLYRLRPGSIANLPNSTLDCFFFSIETLATVGYGATYPLTFYGHVVASLEILTGLLTISLVTGLAFARFSKPRGRFIFSHSAVVTRMDGVDTLMIRVANERHSSIADARCRAVFSTDSTTTEGAPFRRFQDLHLVRDYTPALFLSWTIMHRIDESSPMFGLDAATLRDRAARIQISVTGIDDALSASVNMQTAYTVEHILFDHVFTDILSHSNEGLLTVDVRRIHEVRPIGAALSEVPPKTGPTA